MHRPSLVRRIVCALCTLACILTASVALADVFETRSFTSELDELRYRSMIEELRCLVCQNQTIAASDADLAKDLRDKVYAMINDGRSDQEIVDFMVQRYGDFVLYRPPLKLSTILLWLGPFTLGVIALVVLLRQVRAAGARPAGANEELTEAQREQARALLEEQQPSNQDRP